MNYTPTHRILVHSQGGSSWLGNQVLLLALLFICFVIGQSERVQQQSHIKQPTAARQVKGMNGACETGLGWAEEPCSIPRGQLQCCLGRLLSGRKAGLARPPCFFFSKRSWKSQFLYKSAQFLNVGLNFLNAPCGPTKDKWGCHPSSIPETGLLSF